MKSHVTHTKSHVSSHIYEELQLVGSEYVTLLINMRHNSFKKHWFFCTLFLIINYFELFRKIFFFLDNCSCLSLKIAVEHVTWLIHTRHNSFRYVFLSDMPSSCMREAYLLFECDMSLHICDMTFHICDMTLHMYVTWVTWLSTCVTWDMSSSYMWHDSSYVWHDSSYMWHDSSYMWHDSSYMWHDSSSCMWHESHDSSYVWHDSSYMWHDSSYMWNDSSYMWHGTCHLHICDRTLYICDMTLYICDMTLLHICDMSHMTLHICNLKHDFFIYVTRLFMHMTWHLIFVTWLFIYVTWPFIYVTWLIIYLTCDISSSYMWHDSAYACDMSHMTLHMCDMRHVFFIYVTWLFIYVTWLIIYVTWLIIYLTCDMSSSYMWHDSDKSPSYVTWLMHISHSFICNMTHPFLAVCIRLFTCIHHMTRSSMRGGTSLIKIYDIFLLNKEYVPYKFFGNVFWI